MVTLTMGDTDFEVSPFRLRELRIAGPILDKVGARFLSMSEEDITSMMVNLDEMTDLMEQLCRVFAVGVRTARGMADRPCTKDEVADQLDVITNEMMGKASLADFTSSKDLFVEILKDAGMVKATANPTPTPAPSGPGEQPSESSESSPSLSPPAAVLETGNV